MAGSAARSAYALAFQYSPIILTGGIASSSLGQALPIIALVGQAAAFVQGLGNAIATTSNQVQVLSPLGGATTSTNLNFHQQLGVAAGVAAGQIGSTLDQDAPKGPTITLDANVAVGVML
ncbi:MAG: hypothetical protein B7X10_02120, partial [Burkholderiales bacterium 21-58-4]